jgi:DNA primase
LRELQKTGRIGRIDVEISTENGKTKGKIFLPSSLDSSETALIAASLETIERIGPCVASVKVISVKDVRVVKREFMLNRAKDILGKLMTEEIPPTSTLTNAIRESVKTAQIKDFFGLPAGPDVENSDEVIIVEGRADVLNLLKNGIKNVVAIEGAKIPQPIIDLAKEKITTLFVDGDRGGDLIIKEMFQVAEVDYIARAPTDKEVEELTKKEIFKALREKIPAGEYKIEVKTKELKDFVQKPSQESSA